MNLADLHHLSPTAPPQPTRCESLIVGFRSDPEAIAALLPAPLRADGSAAASLRFDVVPAAGGRGVDIDAQIAVDALLDDMPVSFVARRWADEWPAVDVDAGFAPGRPRFVQLHDSLTAVLESGGRPFAIAGFSRRRVFGVFGPPRCPIAIASAWLARPQLAMRRSVDAQGRAVQRLIGLSRRLLEVRDALLGSAELEFVAPGASPLPLRGVLGAVHVTGERAPHRCAEPLTGRVLDEAFA